jgi:hypothetical protein
VPAICGQWAMGRTGVQGYSGPSSIVPVNSAGTRVEGYADTDANSVGVPGTSPAGRGGIFKGGTAPLKLRASIPNILRR